MKGKLDGIAWRVPIPWGSIVNFVVELKRDATVEKINWLFSEVSKYHLKGILQYTEDPIVSHDIVKNPHSCIFDALLTNIVEKNLVSVSGWYDNEWGYACRMIDLIKLL